MGEVYLAQDTKLDRKVALKILPAEVAAHHDRMKRFVQEAKAASALNHPNIITIHEIDETDSITFIATEFIDGETLRERIRKAAMKLGEVLDVAAQIASALSAAHAAGIVHRDIKPENVMLRRDGIVKVLDFGLAKLSEPPAVAGGFIDTQAATRPLIHTEPGTVMGTVAYMSPEQVRGLAVDARTDIFSLGVVIYEMVAGRAPFGGATKSDLIVALLEKDPPPLARFTTEAPAELERLVMKTLAKDREERYQTAKDLLIDLKGLKQKLVVDAEIERSVAPLDGFGVPPSGGKVSEPTATDHRSVRRGILASRRALIIAAPLALLILTALVYAIFFRRASVPVASDVKSLAVLPFKNIGSDAQDDYLSDGIADELITKLTKLKTIRVVSLSVAMRFKGSAQDAAQIGRELGVDAVVDGTVRKAGDHFQMNVHLINVKDGFEIWADDGFESNIQNLLDAERQLAEAVAVKLKGELTPQDRTLVAKNNTANADAYELFLRGKQQYRNGQSQIARGLFDRAIQLDPNFADAYAWRGRVIYGQFKGGRGDRATLDAALSDANRALQINPNIVSARVTLIGIYHSTGQYEEGLKQGKRALETNPDDLECD
jgi:serine/threonine-protein kinase